MYKKRRLDNGLRVIIHRMPRMQSVALGIWIKVGGRYEGARIKGIAHYLEHLLFKGSRRYSCRKIKESIEGVGGYLNGFTSEEFTCYLAKLPHQHLFRALDVLSDMVLEPLLLESEIEKERTVILEEIKMHRDLPQSYVYELLDELLWPNHPLGQSVTGTKESVSNIKRKDLLQFKRRYYTCTNMVIAASGLLDENEFFKRIEEKFSPLDAGSLSRFQAAQENQSHPKLKIFSKETEQTHLALGFRALRRDHPLRHALGLLHIILGGNMSSRLFNAVREKRGLAYEIGTQIKYFQDTGVFLVHAGIDNRRVEETIKLILEELHRCKTKLVSADEFRRAKDFYLGQLMLALEDTLDHMLWIGEYTAALDKTYSLEEIIKELEAVKFSDLQELAYQIFKEENLNLALIGPLPEEKKNSLSGLLRLK
ncbi:MAG: insulinase family protein [Candidatus Omnitrophica bacterium]|nr:insulinase family protein [Candidatus Omnitrophota bacterium]